MPGTGQNGESGEGMFYLIWRQTVTSPLSSTHLTCPPGLCWRWTQGCSPTQLGRETGMLLGTAGWTGETVYSDVGNISDNQGDLAAGSSWL